MFDIWILSYRNNTSQKTNRPTQFVSHKVLIFLILDKNYLLHVELYFKQVLHLYLIDIIHNKFIVVESVAIRVLNFCVYTFPLGHNHTIWSESMTSPKGTISWSSQIRSKLLLYSFFLLWIYTYVILHGINWKEIYKNKLNRMPTKRKNNLLNKINTPHLVYPDATSIIYIYI